MPKTFHFAIETNETFMPPKSQEEWGEAYFKQRKHVEEMMKSNESPIPIYDLDELIKLSTKSRRTINFEKKKKLYPSRPLNVFLIFRKNYEEGVRRSNQDTKIDVVSKDAAKEWKRWKKCSPVSALFTEIASLAKIYHKYKYPNYKFQPVKRGRNRSFLSSPESLESSPEMDNSSPELSTKASTSTPSPTPPQTPSQDFLMYDYDYNKDGNGMNLFATELTQELTTSTESAYGGSSVYATEFTQQEQQQIIASTESDHEGSNMFATEFTQQEEQQSTTSMGSLTPVQLIYYYFPESPATPSINFQDFAPDFSNPLQNSILEDCFQDFAPNSSAQELTETIVALESQIHQCIPIDYDPQSIHENGCYYPYDEGTANNFAQENGMVMPFAEEEEEEEEEEDLIEKYLNYY